MIIKCPECGHQVSDRAPICPSCGVEIAGHVVKCHHCGEIHLKSDITCPNCHHSLTDNDERTTTPPPTSTPVSTPTTATPIYDEVEDPTPQYTPKVVRPIKEEPKEEPVQQAVPVADDTDKADEEKPKKNIGALIVAFLIAAIICAVMLYMYRDAQQSNEANQYAIAMKSTEPSVLQAYLDTYHDMNQDHANEVKERLAFLSQQQKEAKKAVAKEEKPAEEDTDSLDWIAACENGTEDAYARYKLQHPNGKHNDEADEALKKFARATITMPADEKTATEAVRKMLRAMNAHSAEKLTSTMTSTVTYNDKAEEPASAVVAYMDHLYNNVSRLNWYLDAGKPKVSKASDQEMTIMIPARLSQNLNSGGNAQNLFNIHATVNNEGLITGVKFIRLATPVAKTTTSEKKATTSEKKTTTSEKKVTTTEKKATTSEKKAKSTEKKTNTTEKKATTSEKKSTKTTEKKSTKTTEKKNSDKSTKSKDKTKTK